MCIDDGGTRVPQGRFTSHPRRSTAETQRRRIVATRVPDGIVLVFSGCQFARTHVHTHCLVLSTGSILYRTVIQDV